MSASGPPGVEDERRPGGEPSGRSEQVRDCGGDVLRLEELLHRLRGEEYVLDHSLDRDPVGCRLRLELRLDEKRPRVCLRNLRPDSGVGKYYLTTGGCQPVAASAPAWMRASEVSFPRSSRLS
jgi:hypothetical protein